MKKLNFFECIYKRFIMYKQTLKWYKIVKPATKSHRKIDSCVRFIYQVDEEITAEDEFGNVYTFKADELEDVTAEYLTKKLEQAALFIAGITALVIRCKRDKRWALVWHNRLCDYQLCLLYGLQNSKRRILTFKNYNYGKNVI